MRTILCFLCGCLLCLATFGQNKANLFPTIFEPGVISKGDYESHPAFSPTGDTLYFIKTSVDLKVSAICVSYRKHGKWAPPQIASFSGRYMDADPFVTKNGRAVYFMSNRPLHKNGPVKDDTDIWKTELKNGKWQEPVRLDAPVNSDADEYYPTIADNGTIYFGSTRGGGIGGSDIYKCRLVADKYQPAENLGFNTKGNEFECFTAPDESYVIYNSTQGGLNGLDFYISYNLHGLWSKAQKLPAPLNSDGIEWAPKVTRDGKLFVFSSTRNTQTHISAKAQNMQQFNRRLQGTGNGLADIYIVDIKALKISKKPDIEPGPYQK